MALLIKKVKKMIDFREMTRRFLMGESKTPSLKGYIQSLGETLEGLRPKTVKETHRLAMARQHLREIRRMTRRLEEKVELLEEEMSVLEEKLQILDEGEK